MTLTRDRNAFYLTGKVGEKRSYTPEGFLVCHDVPIARTGTQLYTADEVPIEPGTDGLIRVKRGGEEVFRQETISSFEGKPVTVNHPEEFVNPDNWKNLTVGFVSNVRRGEGIHDDLLLADLVITDADGIEYVNRELPEVSCGYEAEYRQVEAGQAEQHDIIGNHVALVDKGRAGSRCAIQDSAPTEDKMGKEKKNWLDRLRALVKDAEAEEEGKEKESCEDEFPDKEKEEGEKKEAKDADVFEERLARLESVINKLIPMEEAEHGQQLDADPDAKKDDEEETVDTIIEPETAEKVDAGTVLMGDSFQSVLSRAEILCPGIAIPTGDGAKDRKAIPRLQLKAVQHALTNDADVVTPFLGKRELKKLTFDQLAMVFTGAAELKRNKNNGALAAATRVKDFGGHGDHSTPEAINAKNRAFWAANK